jgi:hypothetical protein
MGRNSMFFVPPIYYLLIFVRIFSHLPLANWLYFWWLAIKLHLAFVAFTKTRFGDFLQLKLETSVAAYMRRTALAEYHSILIPTYSFGAKRPILDHSYLASLHNPKAKVVQSKRLKSCRREVVTGW